MSHLTSSRKHQDRYTNFISKIIPMQLDGFRWGFSILTLELIMVAQPDSETAVVELLLLKTSTHGTSSPNEFCHGCVFRKNLLVQYFALVNIYTQMQIQMTSDPTKLSQGGVRLYHLPLVVQDFLKRRTL